MTPLFSGDFYGGDGPCLSHPPAPPATVGYRDLSGSHEIRGQCSLFFCNPQPVASGSCVDHLDLEAGLLALDVWSQCFPRTLKITFKNSARERCILLGWGLKEPEALPIRDLTICPWALI